MVIITTIRPRPSMTGIKILNIMTRVMGTVTVMAAIIDTVTKEVV